MNSTELKVEMLRNKVNLTQLAEHLDITKGALSRKLNGFAEFSRKDISIVKEVFKLTPQRIDEIFFNDNVEFNSTKEHLS